MTLREAIERFDAFRRTGAEVYIFAQPPWTADSRCDVVVQSNELAMDERQRELEDRVRSGLSFVADEDDVVNAIGFLANAGIDDPEPEEIIEALLDIGPLE